MKRRNLLIQAAWLMAFGSLAFVLCITPAHGQAESEAVEDEEIPQGQRKQYETISIQRDVNTPLNERERVHHFLSRFAPGASKAVFDEVLKTGIEAWLDQQLLGISPEPEILHAKLAELPSYFMTNQEVMQNYIMNLPPNPTIEQIREANILSNTPRNELYQAVLLNAVYGSNLVLETSSDFFRNHLTVELNKGAVRYFGMEYEREVIRGNALGSFGTMLMESAKHPAMLFYLDNYLSRRQPTAQELKQIEARAKARNQSDSQVQEALDIARQRGLNENYARELLELHTLGVDRYYSQNDVIEVAKCLTGWTYNGDRNNPVVFNFRGNLHEPGDKRVLGETIKENTKDGVKEGEAVVHMLLKHKGTAYFLAEKLCRYYLNDNPDDRMIARIARVWRKSEGHIPTVLKAIATDKEFYNPKNYQTKYKRPFEFVVSSLRATGADVQSTRSLQYYLTRMQEELYECPDPTGYYDQAEAWNDAGAIALRWKFCADVALGRVAGITLPESLYASLNPRLPSSWADALIDQIMPLGMSDATREKIHGMVNRYIEKRNRPRVRELAPLIVAAVLGSPDFQRQ